MNQPIRTEIDRVHVDEVLEVTAARARVGPHGRGVGEAAGRGTEADRAHVQRQGGSGVVSGEHGHRKQGPSAQRAGVAGSPLALFVGRIAGLAIAVLGLVELSLQLSIFPLEGGDLEGERLAIVPVAHAHHASRPGRPGPTSRLRVG